MQVQVQVGALCRQQVLTGMLQQKNCSKLS